MPRSELARALQSARHDRGVTQSRLSARIGVPVALVGLWEHGEAVPDADQVRAVAGALSVEQGTVDSWLELRSRVAQPAASSETETLTVEILPAASRVVLAEPPWPPPPGPTAAGRVQERPRGAARRAGDRKRRAQQRAGDEARRSAGMRRHGLSEPPVFAPDLLEERSHVIATVNSGSVFPVPGSRRTIERFTYSNGAPTYRVTQEDRMVYQSRRARVVLIMLALAALLWWAVAQLGAGWDAVLDLFRSEEATGTTVGAVAPWFRSRLD